MSKLVYIAGSFKNLNKMRHVYQRLSKSGLDVIISEPLQTSGIDGCLKRIRCADITYILNYDGYVGKSVTMDIGYALGLGKAVYALEPITDPDITHLIDHVISPEELIKKLGGQISD